MVPAVRRRTARVLARDLFRSRGGGSPAFFLHWARRVPADVEILAAALPGREQRLAEPAAADMNELAGALTGALFPLLDRPAVLFGHSMGAAVALEVTRRAEAAGAGPLAGLVVSGCAGPHRGRRPAPASDTFTDEELTARLRELGGTPDELLDDAGMRGLILSAFRDDLRIIGPHRPAAGPRVGTPVRVLLGGDDPATSPGDGPRWAAASERFAGLRTLPGGHFFPLDHPREVIAEVLGMARPTRADAHAPTPSPRNGPRPGPDTPARTAGHPGTDSTKGRPC
ncbi:alpha/beta fold hydrolase [Streptomyces sp. CAU 1734]|uniref:thioesterase II family protein n=1 Tax=Streptomyces sp. CAU 1734 TaxID=3140360 RepID=UPI003260C472